MKLMHYVYVLKSLEDGKLYIGYTQNLEQRMERHKSGRVPSAAPRRPLKKIFHEAYISKKDAKRREEYFKTNKGKSTLKLMLRDTLDNFE